MANLINKKFDVMFHIIDSYQLTIISDVPSEYLCVICGKILVNACQAPCGCNICFKCIDGNDVCPGDSEECKLENLSVAVVDNRMNKQISKLIVKCPLEKCSHECQLLNLGEHLRSCEKQMVECPFGAVGCVPTEKLKGKEGLEMHVKEANDEHQKLLIEIITKLQQRIVELERVTDYKDQQIVCLNEEIESIKNERRDLMEKMEILKSSFENKINEISVKLSTLSRIDGIDSIRDEVQSIRAQRNDFTKEIDEIKKHLNGNVELEMNKKLRDIKLEIDEISEMTVTKLIAKQKDCYLDFEKRMNEVEKILNLRNGIFIWEINKIDEIKKYGYIWSDYFYTNINAYRMRLRMDVYSDQLCIRFCIYNGPNDFDLEWPFQGEVLLKIKNKADQNFGKTITKHCTIDKPSNVSCECSEEFTFAFSDFSRTGLQKNVSFIVECHVKFD